MQGIIYQSVSMESSWIFMSLKLKLHLWFRNPEHENLKPNIIEKLTALMFNYM